MAEAPIGSVDKALRVLDALSRSGPAGLALAEVAAAVDVSKSTVHRTLAALRHGRYVSQDAVTGRYRLGAAALELGVSFFDRENLPAVLRPVLEAVRNEFDELCQLGVLDGLEVVYVDKVEPSHPIRVWSVVGRRVPAVTTALGRALLASQETDRASVGRYAPPGLLTPDEVGAAWEAVVAARLDGYAVEVGVNEPGIGCVAVPVLRARRGVAAITVTMPLGRLEGRTAEIGRRLRDVVGEELPAPLAIPPVL